jgi:hypothetical protein
MECRLRTAIPLARDVPAPYDADGWETTVAKPVVRARLRCAGGNCSDATAGWVLW